MDELEEKVADLVYRPTNKFVPFSAALPVGNSIAINTAPKLHRYAMTLMRCICTATHPCHSAFVIRRGRASPFFVVEPKRIHVGIYPQSGGPITGKLSIVITLSLLTLVSRLLFNLPLFCCRLLLQFFGCTTPIICPPIVPVVEREYLCTRRRDRTLIGFMGSASHIPLHLLVGFLLRLICQSKAFRFLLC